MTTTTTEPVDIELADIGMSAVDSLLDKAHQLNRRTAATKAEIETATQQPPSTVGSLSRSMTMATVAISCGSGIVIGLVIGLSLANFVL